MYGSPSDPVGGTVITVSWAVSNALDPIRWLRLLTGNADPPGTSYVVVSTSTSGTQWQKVTTDVLADGSVTAPKLAPGAALGNIAAQSITNAYLGTAAALANLGYTPVNKVGDSMSGVLTVSTNQAGTASVAIQNASVTGVSLAALNAAGSGFDLYMDHATASLGVAISGTSAAFSGALSAASAAISGALSAASAAISGNATIGGTLGVTGTSTLGVVNSGAVTSSAGGSFTTGTFTGALSALSAAITNAITGATATLTGLCKAQTFESTVATGTAPLVVASTTPVANLHAANADQLGGVAAAGYPTLAGGGSFTTAPTINGAQIDRRTSGSYTGFGPGGANASFDITVSLFSPTLTVIKGSNRSIHFLVGTTDAVGIDGFGTWVFSTGTKNGVNKITIDSANSGPNVLGVSYTWEARG